MCLICGGDHYTKYCPIRMGYPPYVTKFADAVTGFVQKTETTKERGDQRFPDMFAVYEQALVLLQLLAENCRIQQVDPECQGCGGPHRYEDCPVAFRWSIPSVIRGDTVGERRKR
ncbi:hypothetical protein Hanom_Chr11g00989601 [Helianthus anomalus]